MRVNGVVGVVRSSK